MAATVEIDRFFGAGPTACSVSSASLRMGTSDETSPSNVPVPTSGSNYSYWVHTGLFATAAPDNALNNIKWYSDGTNSLGTGLAMVITQASAYVQADGTAGSSGSVLNLTNHVGACAAPVDFVTYTTGTKLNVAGSIAATTGSFGNWVVMQAQVESTAAAGNSGEETITWQWDES